MPVVWGMFQSEDVIQSAHLSLGVGCSYSHAEQGWEQKPPLAHGSPAHGLTQISSELGLLMLTRRQTS